MTYMPFRSIMGGEHLSTMATLASRLHWGESILIQARSMSPMEIVLVVLLKWTSKFCLSSALLRSFIPWLLVESLAAPAIHLILTSIYWVAAGSSIWVRNGRNCQSINDASKTSRSPSNLVCSVAHHVYYKQRLEAIVRLWFTQKSMCQCPGQSMCGPQIVDVKNQVSQSASQSIRWSVSQLVSQAIIQSGS